MNTIRKLTLRIVILSVMFSGVTPVINADFGLDCPELIDATRALYGVAKENIGKLPDALSKIPNILYAAKESISNWPRHAINQTGKILLSPISDTIATYSQYRDPRLLALVAASGILLSAGGIYLLAQKYNDSKDIHSKSTKSKKYLAGSKKYLAGISTMCLGIAGILCSKHIIKALDYYLN
jgi:hypothetical protein